VGELIELDKVPKKGMYHISDTYHVLKRNEVAWVCNCGSVLFFLTPEGAKCQKCGIVSNDWAL